MALRLMFPALPAGDAEPTYLEDWLDLAEADGGFLDSVFDYWDHHGGPLVAADAASPIGTFLAPIVAARGGNASLPLHLLEYLFARFLVLTSELVDAAHPGYRFGAMAISPARLERVFDSLVQAGLDTAASTADGVVTAVMTLHASVSFVHEQWALFADDLIPLQCGYTEVDMAPLLFPLNLAPVGGEPPARRWLAGIELTTMRCPRYTLSPFADLAGFCGVRAPLEARLANPAAPVPPHTGEYRAAFGTLTDLTRTAVVGPPAALFARGSTVVDFFSNRQWPPSLAGWPAAYPDSLLDVRDRARFFDGSNDARADVLCERFPRVLRPLVTLPRVVAGSPPFEQHDYALTLMLVYTLEALPRLLASFQTLDATLARACAHVTSPAATAAGRVQ